jgi:hypothetical protein
MNIDSEYIKHALSHLLIGDQFVQNTIETRRFSAEKVDQFFASFRPSHRNALSVCFGADIAREIIGEEEHHEFDALGAYGKFVGRMAIGESGLIKVERVLHGKHDDALIANLTESCASAVKVLRS